GWIRRKYAWWRESRTSFARRLRNAGERDPAGTSVLAGFRAGDRFSARGAASVRGRPERYFQPECDSNERGLPDYLESEPGEGAGQRAFEKGRGQPSESQCGKRFADPHSGQGRTYGMSRHPDRHGGPGRARRAAYAVRPPVTPQACRRDD